MTKRILAILLVLCSLCGLCSAALADAYGLAIDKLSTRTGPGTEYTEPGTFNYKGQYVHIISRAYDVNNVCWLQVEIGYRGQLMRVYTGLKRFDTSTFDLDDVPIEYPYMKAKTAAKLTFCYGPDLSWYAMQQSTVNRGVTVTVIEDGNPDDYMNMALVEVTRQNGKKVRGWLPWIQLIY